MQLSIFDAPAFEDTIKSNIDKTGDILRDKGIEASINHANLIQEDWGEKAYLLFLEFIKSHTEFKCEDFRNWSSPQLSTPPSLRAFGSIIVRAVKSGLITRIGFENVSNPRAHKTPVSVWSTSKK